MFQIGPPVDHVRDGQEGRLRRNASYRIGECQGRAAVERRRDGNHCPGQRRRRTEQNAANQGFPEAGPVGDPVGQGGHPRAANENDDGRTCKEREQNPERQIAEHDRCDPLLPELWTLRHRSGGLRVNGTWRISFLSHPDPHRRMLPQAQARVLEQSSAFRVFSPRPPIRRGSQRNSISRG
jgi:hypothetical protein